MVIVNLVTVVVTATACAVAIPVVIVIVIAVVFFTVWLALSSSPSSARSSRSSLSSSSLSTSPSSHRHTCRKCNIHRHRLHYVVGVIIVTIGADSLRIEHHRHMPWKHDLALKEALALLPNGNAQSVSWESMANTDTTKNVPFARPWPAT